MKMNHICRITVILSLLAVTACSTDFMEDMGNYGSFNEDLFGNEALVTRVLNNVYGYQQNGLSSPIQTDLPDPTFKDTWTKCTPELGGIQDFIDETKDLTNKDVPNLYSGGSNSFNNVQTAMPYYHIRTCNFVLEGVDKYAVGKLSEEAINRLKGQAYFLRARTYARLIRSLGGVPWVDYVQTADYDNPEIRKPRDATSFCIERICEDLDMAAAMLPGRWNDATDWGRATRGAALALKSRVLLLWASPLYNRDMNTDRWQAALDASLAAEQQLIADGFGLYGEGMNGGINGSKWAEMFKQDNTFNPEAIYVFIFSTSTLNAKHNGWENSIRPKAQDGAGGVSAPVEMIDYFPMADGSRPTAENGYDREVFFKDRDPRFYRTFAFPGSAWAVKEGSPDIWNYAWFENAESDADEFSSPNRTADGNSGSSPAYVRKMSMDGAVSSAQFSTSGTDYMEYRFAELLLTIAECYAGVGDLSNCMQYLSRIRERAGLPQGDNNYGLGASFSTPNQAFEACLYERAIELAYEGKRFYDIHRWMLYSDEPDAFGPNNTCAYLGVEPLNGTRRTGLYMIASPEGQAYYGTDDPLKDRRVELLDPDDASTFPARMESLAEFYRNNLTYRLNITAMDKNGSDATVIDWKPKYYFLGLGSHAMQYNGEFLQQTMGWDDNDGNTENSTFNPLL